MSKILIANWKANPQTLEEAEKLFDAEAYRNVVICPPALYVQPLTRHATRYKVHIGSQDLFWEGGAHTGQISAEMLKQFGVTHVLVGHSERRALGETDEQINKKLKATLTAGMIPILLIGEQEKNDAVRQDILIDQLTRDLEGVSAEDATKIHYTFEPAWAISTTSGNKAESLDNIIAGVEMMKDILQKSFKLQASSFKMLYGASVNGENTQEILSRPELSGAVVGGASLRAEEFKKMVEITAKL
ncbi:MAG: hypothetical protein A3A33_02670 [Candidatus Yanofskybacteria bacterium RIFCSPLOWO2_01_FULL_49_25]|uniref:Triosephosphate isomerase n=1 Tax=Candidatus Yanofskybacteria bacterium RIFCSPLOWO2_01_FULL_49_25 TaxID=1802701 RepID=A0A1F8GV31_9BACT|nr:MAG: hypothetical protein A3A33_02670 [Candidatus Yanofskybacteria bacterium RIFCSPLOWO2_01_FULL_49_25]